MRRALAVHNANAPLPPGSLGYDIDARATDNLLSRELQEGATGPHTGWTTIGPVILSPQSVHAVSNGDGLCAVFADPGTVLPGPGHISLPQPLPSSLTVSAFLRAGDSGLDGVSFAVEFFDTSGGYISGSYGPAFAVSSMQMRQYYHTTGALPGGAASVNVLLQCANAGALYADFICCRPQMLLPQPTATSQARTAEWRLAFADDFETFDSSTWTKAPIGAGDTYGQEQWDPALVTVADSKLRITCELRGDTWFSGIVNSQNKRAWTFGYFEARINLPDGQGLWPAWWIFPNTNVYGVWPRSGEIDILEHLGRPEEVTNGYGSIQKDDGSCAGRNVPASHVATGTNWALDWHTWGLLWERSIDNRVILRYFVDGAPYGMFDQSMWPAACGGPPGSPFDQPFFAIFNLAIGIKPGGPTWAGAPDPAISGRFMEVDWVRVWQR